MRETIGTQLRKIAALADSGSAGEKENARIILAKLCDKYGVDIATLTSPEVSFFPYVFRDEYERKILVHCVLMVCGTRDVENVPPRGRRKVFWFKTSELQRIEIVQAYEHYRKAWKNQLEDVMSAFIHTQELFCPEPTEQDKALTPEDLGRIKRIASMMSGMQKSEWRPARLLGGGA